VEIGRLWFKASLSKAQAPISKAKKKQTCWGHCSSSRVLEFNPQYLKEKETEKVTIISMKQFVKKWF
jgi:hypothetical protein